MNVFTRLRTSLRFLLLLSGFALPASADPELRVVATTPDLGALARAVGGDAVSVLVLTRGPQDPHFVEPRPSFVRKLHDADLFIQVGMDLEIGWAPVLLRSARNAEVQVGAPGFLDASIGVPALEVPTGRVDRSMGDVHPLGNPHYLTDPVNGWRSAVRIRDRLTKLRPAAGSGFDERFSAFERKLAEALVGADLTSRHEPAKLIAEVDRGSLGGFLEARGESDHLGGWLAAFRPHAGTRAVQDHRVWPYFAQRFGLEIVETLEPRPGIAPTTRHLEKVVAEIERDAVPVILASPYFDARHARWVSERTGARIAEMAHQPGARGGSEDDYLAAIDRNVRAVLEAL